MTNLSIEEISARDMRKAAIHECGHAHVARHYGMWAQPDIWRNDNANPYEEPLWSGSTRYHAVNRTPLRHRRIAIAGIVAELMDAQDFEVGSLEEFFTESFECDEWSLTDREGAIGWTPTDLQSVYSILRRNWNAIEAEAEGLINRWTDHHSTASWLPPRREVGRDERRQGRRTASKRKTKSRGLRSPGVVTRGSGFMQRFAVIHPSGPKQ